MVELWHRLWQRGYTRRLERPFRGMRKLGLLSPQKNTVYHPKPYGQMTYPGQRGQADSGFEFTNRFSNSRRGLPTLFEADAVKMDIRHKLPLHAAT